MPLEEAEPDAPPPPLDEEEPPTAEEEAGVPLPPTHDEQPWRERVEHALEEGDANALRLLLEEAGPGAANHGSGQGDGTLLLNLAVQQNSIAMVKALVEFGADPELVDHDDEECALHVAAGLLSVEPTFALDALKLMLTRTTTAAIDDVRDGEGRTVMHVAVGASKQASSSAEAQKAAERAMLGAVELLLTRGCSVAAIDSIGEGAGETVLHVAAEWSSAPCLKLLLGSGHASTAAASEDVEGARPLDRALAAGRHENAKLLLAASRSQSMDFTMQATATRALIRMCHAAGRNPQRRAPRADYAACVRVLVASRADLERRDPLERTPLAAAAASDAPAPLIHALLRAGAKRDSIDSSGRCALMLAAAHGRSEALAELLSLSTSARDATGGSPKIGRLNARDKTGATALMLASAAPSAECVSALIEAGAGVVECDSDGRCALLYAVLPAIPDSPRTAAAEMSGSETELAEVGEEEEVEEASTSVLPYSRPSRSSTLFASLAATGDAARTANDVRAEVVRLLVNADANLKSTGPEGGGTGEAAGEEASSTAATPSLSAGSPESGFALLRQPPSGLSSAAAMALACDVDGRCALAVAAGLADSGAYHAVEAGLASVGGGIKSFGVIALASACLDADVAAARKLLEAGVPADGDESSTPPSLAQRAAALGLPADTPLAAAAYSGSAELVQLLLSHGASPKPKPLASFQELGEPSAGGAAAGKEASIGLSIPRAPLTAAAASGSVACVRALLQAGAPPDIATEGEDGTTPLHAAADSGNVECIEALLGAGVDSDVRDGSGRSALRRAALHGHRDALPLLLPPTRDELEKELDDALVSGELRAAALLAEASGTPSLLWRAIEQQGVDGDLLQGLLRETPREALRRQAVEATGAKRTVLHAAVEAGSQSAVVALAGALPEELLLKPSADGLTAIGLAVLKQADLLAELLERAALARLHVTLEILHTTSAVARRRAQEAAQALNAVWPSLDVKAVACAGPHALAAVWVERWGTSRRSCILAAPSRGAPMPTVESLLLATRKKMEGEGVLAA